MTIEPRSDISGSPRLFLGCAAAIMLHIADDNFLQPADGMTAGDHLLSGTVPLSVLAAGAFAYPRMRAGARAAIALVMAFTGLVVGFAEAGNHLYSTRLSGDDYTGLVAGVAGLLLVGLAVRTLWRSRRTGPTRIRQYARRTLVGVLGIATMTEVLIPFGFGYVVTHVARASVADPELGATYEDVTLTTSDGLRLRGWYVPSRNGAAVIAFPGRTNPQPHTRMLVEHGYGVLLFDRRGEGASEGDPNSFGWGGTRDIVAALDFLEDRPDVGPGRIGGLGLSVGGELMLQTATEDARLAAVVSEGAGTRTLAEELVDNDANSLIWGFHSLAAKHIGVTLFSNESPPPSLVDVLHRVAPRPVLLIWAPHTRQREAINRRYQQLIGPSAVQWEVEDAQHIKGLQADPDEYERRVVGFFDDALLVGVEVSGNHPG